MRRIALLLHIALLTIAAQAQNDEASVNFVRAVVHSDEKIIYADSISSFAVSFIREGLHNSNIHNFHKKNRRFPSFTTDELKYINRELRKMRKFTWKDSLLSNGLLVKLDTFNSIINSKLPFEAWSYFNSHFGEGYHWFSKPIFLRNHTLCIFYEGYSCGWLCGSGDVTIYIKKDIVVKNSW